MKMLKICLTILLPFIYNMKIVAQTGRDWQGYTNQGVNYEVRFTTTLDGTGITYFYIEANLQGVTFNLGLSFSPPRPIVDSAFTVGYGNIGSFEYEIYQGWFTSDTTATGNWMIKKQIFNGSYWQTYQGSGTWTAAGGPLIITIIDYISDVPSKFMLFQNYPNPFNPTTTIKYQIPELSFLTIKVYDVLGNEITALINEEKQIGSYEVNFDATGIPSGVYFYRLQAEDFAETKKMVLIR